MSRAKAWFPYYPADIEADTADLSVEEFGAYVKLLSFHFLQDSIPSDHKRIARILRVSPQKASKLWLVLEHFFYEKDGRFYQKRMEKEIAKAVEISEKRTKAAAKRWDANAKQVHKHVDTQPQPQPHINNKTYTSNASRFDEWWKEYPNKVEKKKTREIWRRRKLDNLAETIIADTKKRQTSHRKWIEGYIPNPSTYLNGDRWEDEYEKPTPKDVSRTSLPKENNACIRFLANHNIKPNPGESMDDFRVRGERAIHGN